MESNTIEFGTRKLQQGTGGFNVNIPIVLVNSFGMKAHDKLAISTTDGEILLKRVGE